MSTQKSVTSSRELLFNWVLMSIAGFFIGLMLRRGLLDLLFYVTSGGLPAKVLEGVIIGLVIGLAHLFILPARIPRSAWFVGASALGWAIGWGSGWSLAWGLLGALSLTFAAVGGLAGLFTGIGQWFMLRRHLAQAGWWIPANAVGWSVALALGSLVRATFGWPLAGAVAGSVTGYTLIWLLRRTPQISLLAEDQHKPTN